MLLDNGLQEWFHPELMPPIGYFKREKKIDFSCVDSEDTWCFIDFVIGVHGGFLFLEVDENQHQFGYNGKLSCDMKRMNKVMTSLIFESWMCMPPMYWLRYNPNAWHIDGELQHVLKVDREAWLQAFVARAITDGLHMPLQVGYAYYDVTDDTLEVLSNPDFNAVWKDIVENVTTLK